MEKALFTILTIEDIKEIGKMASKMDKENFFKMGE